MLEEVGHEPRLSDPGGAEQREQPARAVGDRVLVVAPEPLPLALAADERPFEMARDRLRAGEHLDEAERGDGLGLSLERERLDRLDAHGVAHEEARLAADQDRARGPPPARGARRR